MIYCTYKKLSYKQLCLYHSRTSFLMKGRAKRQFLLWNTAGIHGEEKKPHMDISSRISSRFDRFIAHIRPSRAQLEGADQQVAFLRERLTEHIAADKQFHLEKIFRAGSVAKHTNLARTGKDTFDIDLGVYYRAQGPTKEQLSNLLPYTHARLREIYPVEKPDRKSVV